MDRFDKRVLRYNSIMYEVGNPHLTIGTSDAENPMGEPRKDEWTLRDMVSECQYQLDCHYEGGHCYEEMRYSDDEWERKQWRRNVGRLQRFIKAYADEVEDMGMVTRHCSRWDRSINDIKRFRGQEV